MHVTAYLIYFKSWSSDGHSWGFCVTTGRTDDYRPPRFSQTPAVRNNTPVWDINGVIFGALLKGLEMREVINEEVSVVMSYSSRKKQAMPYLLNWQNKDYYVGKIGYYHSYLEGQDRQHIFELVDKEESLWFRLRFNSGNLHWTLEAVHDGFAA